MSLTEDFLTYLRVDRNRSPATITTYRRTFATFPGIEHADRDAVEEWWASRRDKSPRTRANELAAVRSFFTWCRRFEHRPPTDDPTHRLDAPAIEQRLPRPIGRADLHKAMGAAGPELRRALALGAYAGLRVAEAAALDWDDVDLEERRIYVRGKGMKERVVPLGPVLLDELLPRTGGNVVMAGKRAQTAGGLQQKVNGHLRQLGIDATFHKLRSRYASRALGQTGNLLLVSRALGHANPATTAIYAATSDADLDLIAAAVEG